MPAATVLGMFAVQPVAEEPTGAAGLRGEITSFASLVSTLLGIFVAAPTAPCGSSNSDSIGRITTEGRPGSTIPESASRRDPPVRPHDALWFMNRIGGSIGYHPGENAIGEHPDTVRQITAAPTAPVYERGLRLDRPYHDQVEVHVLPAPEHRGAAGDHGGADKLSGY